MAATRRTAPRDFGVAQKWAAIGIIEMIARSRADGTALNRSPMRGKDAAGFLSCAVVMAAPPRSSELGDDGPRRPKLSRLPHPLFGARVTRRQLAGDVQALVDHRLIAELPERLRAPQHAVDGTVAPGPDEGGQVGLARVHPRAANGSRSVPDGHEGIAHGDHAVPAPARESRAVGVVPDADGDIDPPVLQFLLDEPQMGAPEAVIRPRPTAGNIRSHGRLVRRGVRARKGRASGSWSRQGSAVSQDAGGDDAQGQ